MEEVGDDFSNYLHIFYYVGLADYTIIVLIYIGIYKFLRR